MKTIDVEIDGDGNVQVGTSGFQGSECKKATAELERALGKTTNDQVTPEYHQRGTATLKQGR